MAYFGAHIMISGVKSAKNGHFFGEKMKKNFDSCKQSYKLSEDIFFCRQTKLTSVHGSFAKTALKTAQLQEGYPLFDCNKNTLFIKLPSELRCAAGREKNT